MNVLPILKIDHLIMKSKLSFGYFIESSMQVKHFFNLLIFIDLFWSSDLYYKVFFPWVE